MFDKEYPKDYFLPIEGEEFLEGRLSVHASDGYKSFWVDIAIVNKESRKIWKHIKTVYNYDEEDEAVDAAVQILSKALRGE